MFVEIVAAAAVAALTSSDTQPAPSQAAGATTVTPLVVAPLPKGDKGPPPVATIVMQTDDNAIGTFASAWPESAYRSKTPGEVRLNCDIDRYGLAEWCEVLSESPEGKGFGRAAMVLRPTFKVAPAMGPGGPIDSMMTIAIEFKPPDVHIEYIGGDAAGQGAKGDCGGGSSTPCPQMLIIGNNPMQRRSVTMVDHPIWIQAAGFADLAAAYPAGAGDVEGYAVAHCAVERSGSLEGCQVTKEAPEKARLRPRRR